MVLRKERHFVLFLVLLHGGTYNQPHTSRWFFFENEKKKSEDAHTHISTVKSEKKKKPIQKHQSD